MKIDSLTKDKDAQPTPTVSEEDQYVCSDSTLKSKFEKFTDRLQNSHKLMKYFLTLYDRKYEKELPKNLKHLRDRAESVIFWSSIGGRLLGTAFVVSILRRRRLSPIKDLGTLAATFGTIYLMDSLPMAYYWPYFEDEFIRRDDEQEFTADPYAAADLDGFRVWYYQKLY